MNKIIWSANAVSDYEQNIDYLLSEWGIKATQEFINEINSALKKISKMPEMFPMSNYRNVRKCVIRKQITIFYKINSEGKIEIVRVWNNKQNPEKLKF